MLPKQAVPAAGVFRPTTGRGTSLVPYPACRRGLRYGCFNSAVQFNTTMIWDGEPWSPSIRESLD